MLLLLAFVSFAVVVFAPDRLGIGLASTAYRPWMRERISQRRSPTRVGPRSAHSFYYGESPLQM